MLAEVLKLYFAADHYDESGRSDLFLVLKNNIII
jgi:hypothetical protein